MNINDLENKEYSHFEEKLSSFIIFNKKEKESNEPKENKKEIQLPINIKGNIDFSNDNVLVKIVDKDIIFSHLLICVLSDMGTFKSNKFEIYHNKTKYLYSYNIQDKFEFINTICDLLNLKIDNLTILYDLETTGLDTSNDKIVQLYAEEQLFGTPLYYGLINPEMKIPEVVINIHHITNEMVKNQPRIEDVKKILNFKLRNVGRREIWAHNGFNFDHKINKRYELFGYNIIEKDSVYEIKRLVYTDSYALLKLYRKFCKDDVQLKFHDAKDDVYAMKQLLIKFNILTESS
jgi:DNA polymerase III epsilon subunit-like protein